jgi:hypothetical protein
MSRATDPQPRPGAERAGRIVLAGLFLAAIGYAARERQDDGTVAPMVSMAAGGTADSNNRMIAVTGVDVTGQSVLYLVDTAAGQLAVYQANGGSSGTRGVQLVGARRIDLDLQLEGFNDRTEDNGRPLKRADLERLFQEKGLLSEK